MRNRLKIVMQYLVPQRLLSWFAGVLCECRWRWWKNWQINFLIERYGADLRSAQLEDIEAYPTFNSFFTRYLKPDLRPIVQGAQQIACPVDGSISQIGSIQQDQLFQAKGFYFNLNELLGGSEAWTKVFIGGQFATLYLAPKDYHRVHIPFTGILRETIYIPGKLFSVNTLTAQSIPQLFSKNERLVCLFDTTAGSMAVILVGAMLVSSIRTVWAREQMIASKIIKNEMYPESTISLERGAELGHFRMGSTVIVLFAKHSMQWTEGLQAGSVVQMGQLLGTFCHTA
ncbi:MAG: phosphatidylserine decarboxylase [Gammaproteobacteria bacterium]|nr:phosphatidylserine decarboxylase [Gammaproteobacteria bacterium]